MPRISQMVCLLLLGSFNIGCKDANEGTPGTGSSSSSSSSSTSSSSSSSTSSSSTSSTSSSGGPTLAEFCESRGDVFDSPAYPILVTDEAGELHLANVDFEDEQIGVDAITHNTDPMYVYSGSGSAQLIDQSLKVTLDGNQDLINAMGQLTFWIYLAGDEALEFIVAAGGRNFQPIVSDGPGWGFSGSEGSSEKAVTVEPHQWVHISMDVVGLFGNCASFIEVGKRDTDINGVDFYIDEIKLHLDPAYFF